MQQLLVIRHAIAEDRDEATLRGLADRDRALTPEGIKKMQQAAHGLHQIYQDIQHIYSSPLVRAVQTAEIIAQTYGKRPITQTPLLSPGFSSSSLLTWLKEQNSGSVALVGHEPDLSSWISWALTENKHSLVKMKKGGACLLLFGDELKAGCAELQWLLTPSQLRQLGKKGK